MAVEDVERAAEDLIRAVTQLSQVLDAEAEEGAACQYISYKLPIELEQLAMRISTGQALGRPDVPRN